MSYRLTPPVIRWGTNLANAVYFPFPADSVFSGENPRPGSEFDQAPSGAEDSWYAGTDYTWQGVLRWLQQVDTVYYPRCTGWDGSLGIRAALNWMRQKNSFSWHPDGRNLLRLPLLNSAGAVTLGGLGGWATFTDSGLTSPANTYDGAENAWQLSVAGNASGVTKTIQLFQSVPAIAGEQFCLSADFKALSLTGGAVGTLQVDALDSSFAFLQTIFFQGSLTNSGSYARQAVAFGTAAPTNTAYARVYCYLSIPNGATGSVRFKNVMLRRDSTSNTFIDNPSVDSCYLVQPMQFDPRNESDGTRQLALTIRNASSPFDGY